MNCDDLISIVLPIYNVEKYLNRCIQSIIAQSYQNLEIILVDDGSPDRCPQMCDEWAIKDNRIRVIHKRNAGLGMARNTGIENASGKYICFFDSDDFIKEKAIEEIHNVIAKNEADIALFGYYDYSNSKGTISEFIPCKNNELFCGSDVINRLLVEALKRHDYDINLSAWSCMYSAELIKNTGWKFSSERDIISEDVYSLLELYSCVQRAVIIPKAYYYYCINETSLTKSYREDRFAKIGIFYSECKSLANSLNYPSKVVEALAYPYLANILGALKLLSRSGIAFSKKIEILDGLYETDFASIVNSVLADSSGSSLKRRIILYLFKLKSKFVVLLLFRFSL